MAQAAVQSSLNGDLLIGRAAGVPRMKRKTPSELRGEQLKRRASDKPANDQSLHSAAFDRASNGFRTQSNQKNIEIHQYSCYRGVPSKKI
ncbi:hypothetical protein EE612_061018 [Oryza sativa]|nr:hypothetical protein EE612_061018 [Oryza sativa]